MNPNSSTIIFFAPPQFFRCLIDFVTSGLFIFCSCVCILCQILYILTPPPGCRGFIWLSYLINEHTYSSCTHCPPTKCSPLAEKTPPLHFEEKCDVSTRRCACPKPLNAICRAVKGSHWAEMCVRVCFATVKSLASSLWNSPNLHIGKGQGVPSSSLVHSVQVCLIFSRWDVYKQWSHILYICSATDVLFTVGSFIV